MYNELGPSKWKRDQRQLAQDRRDTILILLFLAVFVVIMLVEYSGLADKFINSFS